MLGEALRRNQRTRASVDFYKRALEQDPSRFAYYARLGGVYIALGEGDRAATVFHLGVLRFPKLPEAYYFAGVAARAAADYPTAEAELRKALALEPDNVNALAQLGFVVLERDRTAEAETILRRAIAINDKHFYANYDLGRLLVKSHRYDQALPLLQHAATLRPNNPSVHYQLFMALLRLKRKDEADRELTLFKQLDEAHKTRPRSDVDIEDDDLQNPSAASPSAPPETFQKP
jgi:Flp pilus assembly protein TadD